MRLRVTFDGTTEVLNPGNWLEVSTNIQRIDEDARVIGVRYIADVEFIKDAYTYLLNKYNSTEAGEGFCSTVEVLWEIDTGAGFFTYFDGLIILKDVTFNLTDCIAITDIKDNSFYAKIEINQKVKAKLDVGYSKNANFDESPNITPVTPLAIDFLSPATGASFGTPQIRDVYLVNDAFRFLIDFMTDGTVDYISDYFGTGGDGEGVGILTTTDMASGTGISVPDISFEDLFKEINKKFNILLVRDDNTDGSPRVRIEPLLDLFGSNVVATFNNVDKVELSTSQDALYSRVDVGASDTQDTVSGAGVATPQVRFITFLEEDYGILGNCNTDSILSLVSEWIIDSNIIYDIVLNGITDYEDRIAIIHVDTATNETANTDIFNTATYYPYNVFFNNQNSVNRWFAGIPNGIQRFLGSNNNTFNAIKTVDQVLTSLVYTLIEFSNDSTGGGTDPGGNYTNTAGNYRYNAPANGLYTFQMVVEVFSTVADIVSCQFDRRDGGGTIDNATFTMDVNRPSTGAPNPNTGTFTWTTYLNAGEFVQVYAYSTFTSLGTTLRDLSTFSCTATDDGGGIYAPTPGVLRYKVYDFKTPITVAQAVAIMSDTKGKIALTSRNGFSSYGWINSIDFDLKEQIATVQLLTDDTP